ncbi:replicative DNA helicase [Asticcacaulis benevestitus]|nr:DnaB-like helicase C-terminal domain-containing protein [Asticcacaulis benevestitus]
MMIMKGHAQLEIANVEAEQDLIGCVMANNSQYAELSHIKPHHMVEAGHARLWEALTKQIDAGGTANAGSLRSALRGDRAIDDLNAAAGQDYLSLLCAKAAHPSWAQDCATAIIDDWTRREAVGIGQNVIALASENNPRPALEVLSYARNALAELETQSGVSEAEFQAAPDVATSVLTQLAEQMRSGKTLGKRCGLRCVDRRMGGFHKGSLIILGGRPSMGKTALARALAHGCAVENPKDQVLFLGIEMSPDEMLQRELAAISASAGDGVEYRDIAMGKVRPEEMSALHRAHAQVPANLILQDVPSLSIDDVRRSIWSRKRKGPLSLVVIDYLQIMRRPEARGRNETAVLGEITSSLKQIARQAGCAIVLLSQLSRQVESREDKRPQLSDLRESGSIEQDADFVFFVYRESYYLERQKPKKGNEFEHEMSVADLQTAMEVICAKARRAPVGTDMQTYQAEFDLITDPRGEV